MLTLILAIVILIIVVFFVGALLRPAFKRSQSHTPSTSDSDVGTKSSQGSESINHQASKPQTSNKPSVISLGPQLRGSSLGLGPVDKPTSLAEASTDGDGDEKDIETQDAVAVAPPRPASLSNISSAGSEWAADFLEIEAGLGVVCAKDNSYKDELFIQAQNYLKRERNLFLMSKNDADIVKRKECSFVLASKLSDISTNPKIRDAFERGIPVVLASEVLASQPGDPVKAYLSHLCIDGFRDSRRRFEENWDLIGIRLDKNMKYFLTHSSAGYPLLAKEEAYLADLLGPKVETKNSISKNVDLDFVVVPTLRTTSAKFAQVLERQTPVLAVKSVDVEGVSVGDEVPAWRWLGGKFFSYPAW